MANSVFASKSLPVGVVVVDSGDKALPPALVMPATAGAGTHSPLAPRTFSSFSPVSPFRHHHKMKT